MGFPSPRDQSYATSVSSLRYWWFWLCFISKLYGLYGVYSSAHRLHMYLAAVREEQRPYLTLGEQQIEIKPTDGTVRYTRTRLAVVSFLQIERCGQLFIEPCFLSSCSSKFFFFFSFSFCFINYMAHALHTTGQRIDQENKIGF